jgi:hypothetical protein
MLGNTQIAMLRDIAGDERIASLRRLAAVDDLAADGGLWVTRRTEPLAQAKVGTRARRNVVTLLRKLLRTSGYLSSQVLTAVKERLLFLASGQSEKGNLWKMTPEGVTKTQVTDPAIAEALRKWKETRDATDTRDARAEVTDAS